MKTIPVYDVKLVRSRPSLRLAESYISGPPEAAKVLHALIGTTDREHFAVLFVNAARDITGVHVAHIGGQSNIEAIDLRVILRAAISACAAAIIVGHNHPSGDPSPSTADRATTVRLAEACKVVGLDLLDHVIVTRDANVYSHGWMHAGGRGGAGS